MTNVDPFSHLSQIDVVNCRLDGRVYIRKSIEKRFAFKTRDVSVHVHLASIPFLSVSDLETHPLRRTLRISHMQRVPQSKCLHRLMSCFIKGLSTRHYDLRWRIVFFRYECPTIDV